jgi:hypothetical protein
MSQLFQELRNRYVNSEGLSNVSTLPSDLAVFASAVYQRFFTIYNALQPNSVSQQTQSVTTWTDLARLIGEIDALEGNLKEYTDDYWFTPISIMMLINPPTAKEDIDSWLNRLLRNEETADLAVKAQSYLTAYRRVIRINIKSGTGSCSSEYPMAEPGLKALQSGTSDVYSKLRRSLPLSDTFNNYIEDFLDLLARISPNLLIVTGDSIIMKRYAKQMFPASWYNLQSTITGDGPNSLMTGFNSRRFVLDAISAQDFVVAKKVQSRSNLVISPGMTYILNIGLMTQVVTAMAAIATLTVTSGTETRSTTVGVAGQSNGPNSVISIPLEITNGTNGPELNYTLTWSSTAPMAGGQELHVALEESIAVVFPVLKEQKSSALISRKQVTTYEEISSGAMWYQFFGTQDITDAMIDEDLSLAGYIDNYVKDEFAIKVVVEILQKLHSDGTFSMRVVSEGDATFAAAYQGEAGMTQLLQDLTERGVSCFLSKNHIFNNGGVVSKVAMMRVFERFHQLLRTVQALYNYGNNGTIEAVHSIIDPGF